MSIQYSDKNADAVGTLNETYNITVSSTDQFSIAIDGGSNQVFTLTPGSARTAAQIVTDLTTSANGNTPLTGATATVCAVNGVNFVRIRTTSANGASSTILVNAPTHNANAILGFTATTYTGGANVVQNFTGDTKQNIINGIEAGLNAAGWITISGHQSSPCLLQSSMSPANQNLRMRVRLVAGTTNCQISIENVQGTKVGTNNGSAGGQLLPNTAKGWRIIANKYQAFIFVPGSIATNEFCSFGIVFVPTWLQGILYEAMWLGAANGFATGPITFRTSTQYGSTNGNWGGNHQLITNSNFWENNGTTVSGGQLQLFQYQAASSVMSPTIPSFRWHDFSTLLIDPLVSWGLTSTTDEALIRGQLFDAFLSNDIFPAETIISGLDSHNWSAITHNNPGSTSTTSSNFGLRGTLFVATS
jgi:hypothetical protein